MANYATLKAAINAVIKANGQREITGTVLNQTLNAMVNSLGVNYQLAGVATPSTNPGTPDQNVFYLAFEAGTYTNFNATVLSAGISILMWNGSWSSQTFYTIDATPTTSSNNLVSSGAVFDAIKTDGSAYDVSAHFPNGGPNNDGKFTLEYILSNANTLIPTAWRKGGMSIKFVQSNDNKYVQARCMAQNFTTDVTQWQGVDDEPTVGSQNLVKSGGVTNIIYDNFGLIKLQKKYTSANSQLLLSNVSIPAGTKVRIIVTSDDAVWSRFAIHGNTSQWNAGWVVDNIAKGVEKVFLAPVDITNIYGYLINATAFGTLTISIAVERKFVHAENIFDKAIQTSKIDDNAVTSDKISNLSISTNKIANDAVLYNKIGGYSKASIDSVISNIGYKIIEENVQSYVGIDTIRYKSIPAGTTIVNNGVPVALGSDTSFTHRKNISTNETWISNFAVNHIQTMSTAGDVDIDIIRFIPYFRSFDSLVDASNIRNAAVTKEKIGVKQIDSDCVNFINSQNLVDKTKLNIGKYVVSTGLLYDNASYNTTDYIILSPGTTYYCGNGGNSVTVRFVAFYDIRKSSISAAYINEWVSNFVCPENAAFARVTFQSWALHLQIESSPITEYHPYKELIDSNLLPDAVIPDGAVSTSKLANGAVTQDKIAEGVSFAPTPPKFKGFSVSNSALANGEQLYTSIVEVPKQVNLTTIIKGAITSVLIGIAKGDFYGKYIEITATQIKVYQGTSTEPANTYNHGLTLTDNTVVSIIKGNESGATVKLITDKGNIFSQQISWLGAVGRAFVENNNGVGTIDVQLSFFLKDITKKVWLFGDSYYNIYDNKRWPWYLVSWGFTNYLIDAKGGQTAASALSDFQNLLNLGSRPSFALWGLGMNGGADENNTVNATWLSNTQSFLALCEQYSITPILATIPTVPSGAHAKLNEWVRNSGYRYIDFASAVEADGSNYWKYWGTDDALLSSDEVHPTAKGAAVLASQAILDFQEMTLAAD